LVIAVLAVVGAGAGFTLVTYLTDTTFPWFRFYILWVPIAVLLVGTLFSSPVRIRHITAEGNSHPLVPEFGGQSGSSSRKGFGAAFGSALAVVIAVLLLTPSIFGTMKGMDNASYAPDLVPYYGYIWHKHLDAQDQHARTQYADIELISRYISAQNFPIGDVVIDTGQDCVPNIVTNVTNPRVFVITNDRDYQRVLDDPLTFGAHFLVGATGSLTDSVSQQYPGLAKGVSWARPVHTFSETYFCPKLTLYRVTGHPDGFGG